MSPEFKRQALDLMRGATTGNRAVLAELLATLIRNAPTNDEREYLRGLFDTLVGDWT